MSPKSFLLSEELQSYIVEHSLPLDDVQRALIEETAALGDVSGMEVGTFTGYSALCIARGLADGGRLLCCDVSEEWTAIARRHWEVAGVADRIDLRIAPASETLRGVPQAASIDLAFIDADKRGYRDYAEQIIPRLCPGGVLLVDNVLWHGAVLEADADVDTDAAHIRAFNDWLAGNDELDGVILPIADGLTMARRR
jgi:caffeoyl-CoA O-methyltransferase